MRCIIKESQSCHDREKYKRNDTKEWIVLCLLVTGIRSLMYCCCFLIHKRNYKCQFTPVTLSHTLWLLSLHFIKETFNFSIIAMIIKTWHGRNATIQFSATRNNTPSKSCCVIHPKSIDFWLKWLLWASGPSLFYAKSVRMDCGFAFHCWS